MDKRSIGFNLYQTSIRLGKQCMSFYLDGKLACCLDIHIFDIFNPILYYLGSIRTFLIIYCTWEIQEDISYMLFKYHRSISCFSSCSLLLKLDALYDVKLKLLMPTKIIGESSLIFI